MDWCKNQLFYNEWKEDVWKARRIVGQNYKLKGGVPSAPPVFDQCLRKGGDKRLINPQQQDRHLELRMFYHYAEWLATIR